MHKKNTVHSGVIEQYFKNGESSCILYFVQRLLSGAPRDKIQIRNIKTCDPVQANYRRESGPDRHGLNIDRIPDRIKPNWIYGRLLDKTFSSITTIIYS
jgi:hypothetical protein